jgi:hypothetical protein
MTFTNGLDNVWGLGRHYQRIVHDLSGWERTMRPYQQMLKTHERMLKNLESPLACTMRDIQAATTVLGGQRSSIMQTVADQARSVDLAKTWGMSSVAADVAHSFSTNNTFQDLTTRIMEQQQQPFHGLAARLMEQQLRPFQSLATHVTATGLQRDVMHHSWRPVLMRGFQVPTFKTMSEITTTVDALNGTLAKVAQLHTTPVSGMLRDVQAWQAEVLGSRVARALSGAARTSSAWDQLREAIKGYQLWAVRVASLPRSDVLTYKPPTPDLLGSEVSPLVVEPPTPEQPVDTPAAHTDCPQELTGN